MAPKKRGSAALVGSGVSSDDDDMKSGGNVETASSPESSKPMAVYDVVATPPASPQSNRDRYMALASPTKVTCALATVGLTSPNSRFDFQAVVLVVYPSCDKPCRRHVALVDASGSAGITVWSNHVSMFDATSVGQVVKITNLTIATHNGKRSLAMARDSSIKFLADAELTRSSEKIWWDGLLKSPAQNIATARMFDDDTILSVSGILFTIQTETKKVREEERNLVTIRLADQSGYLDIRDWNHDDAFFRRHLEKPTLFQRIRLTSFAGNKVAEMLDGDGTVLRSDFFGSSELATFWNAPCKV